MSRRIDDNELIPFFYCPVCGKELYLINQEVCEPCLVRVRQGEFTEEPYSCAYIRIWKEEVQ
jgi:hypothetical protein